MNLREWLDLGRPTVPPRRSTLEPTTPASGPLRCMGCGKVLIAAECRYSRPGDFHLLQTLDACGFSCALKIVQREARRGNFL